MTNQNIAMDYIKYFCSGDIDRLEPLLADNLCFTGTLQTYTSSRNYIESLKSDPPEKCIYKIISITQNEDSVAIFYEYQKPDRTIQIAQLFKIIDQKIKDIHLIFDSKGLA